jgi:predicted RNA-binding protein with PIN domain
MLTYFIDGNNLMWKIPELKKLAKLNSPESRARLVFMLDRYFSQKNVKVRLFFDGAPNDTVRSSKMRISYSYAEAADVLIREEIDRLKTKHTATIVSSDAWIKDYAKVNGCKVMKSEEFVKAIKSADKKDEEKERIKGIDNDEILSMFLDE